MREQCLVEQSGARQLFGGVPVQAGFGLTQMMVAHIYGVPLEALLASTRGGRRAAEARQVAMYLSHVVFRFSLSATARAFGRDRTAATHACRRVEGLRDDPERDRMIAWLEALLRNAATDGAAAGRVPQ